MGKKTGLLKLLNKAVERKKLTAYHGTPHEVDQFSMDKIGTGEGAQAYGHGLYFAEHPETAIEYRDKLTDVNGGMVKLDNSGLVPTNRQGTLTVANKKAPLIQQADLIKSKIQSATDNPDAYKNPQSFIEQQNKLLSDINQQIESLSKKGNLYKVELDIDPDTEMLDFDKPFLQQSDAVKQKLLASKNPQIIKALETSPIESPDGEYFSYMGNTYDTKREALEDFTPSRVITGQSGLAKNPQDVSKTLHALGIKGIKYSDAVSRGTGQDTSNFVVFDDSLISIAEKNGIPFEQVTNLAKQKGVTNQQALSMLVGGSTGIALMGGGERAEAGGLSALGKLPKNLERAVEQGFDINRPVYHGTSEDFTEFDPDRAIGTQFWSTTDKAAIEAGEVGAQGQGVIKEMYHNIKNPAGWKEYDSLTIDEMISRGYDGIALPEGDEITYIAFDPSQYRETDAKFLKKNIGKPYLKGQSTTKNLAGVAAGSTAGAAAAPILSNVMPRINEGREEANARFDDSRKRGFARQTEILNKFKGLRGNKTQHQILTDAGKNLYGAGEIGLSLGQDYASNVVAGISGLGNKFAHNFSDGLKKHFGEDYEKIVRPEKTPAQVIEGLRQAGIEINREPESEEAWQQLYKLSDLVEKGGKIGRQILDSNEYTRGMDIGENFNQSVEDLSKITPLGASILKAAPEAI